MKHKLFLLFLSVAILLGLSMTASAGTYKLTLTAFSSTPGNSDVGPYKGTLTYGTITDKLNIDCDDYSDKVNVGETWAVTEHGFNNLTGVLYGPTHSFYSHDSQEQAYAEALWIADELLTHPKLPAIQVVDDQYALWTLFTPFTNSALVKAGVNLPGYNAELAAAQGWWAGCDASASAWKSCMTEISDLIIYTPVPGSQPRGFGPPQEFIGTPEPASMLLLGSFLSLAGGLLSKKTRRA